MLRTCDKAGIQKAFNMRTRRQFLVNCSIMGITASLSPTALAAPRARRVRRVALDDVTFADLAAEAGSVFVVRAAPKTLIPLVLTQIDAPRQKTGLDAANEKFTLVFAGALDQALEQNTYTFQHPALGVFPLFITRVGSRDAALCCYEAVFNRPPETERRRRRIRKSK
jgi:hypothetical protein